MLKPYVCVACEKVVLGKDDVASLIGLFSKLMIEVPSGTEIPSNAVTPKEWCVFSIWDIDPGDELKELFLCTKILYPDGSQFANVVKTKMKMEPKRRVQNVVQVPGFPIGQMGDYTILTWIEENEKPVVEPIEFKIGLEAKAQ